MKSAWRVGPVIGLVRKFIFPIQSQCKYFLRSPRGIVVFKTSTVSPASLSMTYFSCVSHKTAKYVLVKGEVSSEAELSHYYTWLVQVDVLRSSLCSQTSVRSSHRTQAPVSLQRCVTRRYVHHEVKCLLF